MSRNKRFWIMEQQPGPVRWSICLCLSFWLSVCLLNYSQGFYAFYVFYAWWIHFPQSGALAEGTSLGAHRRSGPVITMSDNPLVTRTGVRPTPTQFVLTLSLIVVVFLGQLGGLQSLSCARYGPFVDVGSVCARRRCRELLQVGACHRLSASICMSVCLPTRQCVCACVFLSVCLLSLHLSVRPSVCLRYLSVYLSLYGCRQ